MPVDDCAVTISKNELVRREKISKAMKGRKLSDSWKKKIGKANSKSLLGKKHSKKTRQKRSESLKEWHRNNDLSDKVRSNFIGCRKGASLTDDQKKHLRNINTGKTHSNETKEKCRKIARKFQMQLEQRERNSKLAVKRNQDPNSNFGYTNNKKAYYKDTRMRSSWEVKFAKMCDERGITWEYEPKTFKLSNRRYTPDFYIEEVYIWIEVKPRNFHKTAWILAKQFEEETLQNITVLDLKDFEEFFDRNY